MLIVLRLNLIESMGISFHQTESERADMFRERNLLSLLDFWELWGLVGLPHMQGLSLSAGMEKNLPPNCAWTDSGSTALPLCRSWAAWAEGGAKPKWEKTKQAGPIPRFLVPPLKDIFQIEKDLMDSFTKLKRTSCLNAR